MANGHRDKELEALVEQYAALIDRVVRQVAGPHASTIGDDVQQRVLVAMWRQIEREQTIHSPASYIYRIAVRETVRAVRAHVRSTAGPIADDVVASIAGPDQTAGAREKARAVEQSMKLLKVDRRRAVRAHLAGFTVEEIMRMYGWGYQTARNLIARGISDLRTLLRARGIDG